MGLVLIVIVLLLLFGGLPDIGPIQHGYGYGPSSILGVVLIVLLVLLLLGRL